MDYATVEYCQIVAFQFHDEFKVKIDYVLKLYIWRS